MPNKIGDIRKQNRKEIAPDPERLASLKRGVDEVTVKTKSQKKGHHSSNTGHCKRRERWRNEDKSDVVRSRGREMLENSFLYSLC